MDRIDQLILDYLGLVPGDEGHEDVRTAVLQALGK